MFGRINHAYAYVSSVTKLAKTNVPVNVPLSNPV